MGKFIIGLVLGAVASTAYAQDDYWRIVWTADKAAADGVFDARIDGAIWPTEAICNEIARHKRPIHPIEGRGFTQWWCIKNMYVRQFGN
jgi:hypothetical protein